MTDNYVTRAAAARLLGVSPRTVTTYIRGGKLKGAFKLGQVWVIPKVNVEELAKARPKSGFKRGRKRRTPIERFVLIPKQEEPAEARPEGGFKRGRKKNEDT